MPRVFDHFVVLKPDLLLDQLQVSPEIYQQLDDDYGQFRGHVLVAAHQFTEDWPTWEIHPAGDELVILLSGKTQLILRTESGNESVVLQDPGSFFVVPKNTWHTAHIDQPSSMLFITPGEGTINAEAPQDDL